MLTIYGIPNCDTVKKVFDFMKAHKIAYEFHDYKKSGIGKEKLQEWTTQKDWSELVNKKSTTWRALDEATQLKIKDAKSAIKLMSENTSVIKRPVIEKNNKIVSIGFDAACYEKLFT
jgi:arsenate reductase